MTDVPETIVCVDCGGRAHLLTRFADDDPPGPDSVAAYRCEDCLDRWDIVLGEADGQDV
ncbi:MAG TPA: hypothetical protein VFP54_02800 [Acidimicrobiales bacterium]|nr:hypothetical protein [Acidimicrobiales bacterium]